MLNCNFSKGRENRPISCLSGLVLISAGSLLVLNCTPAPQSHAFGTVIQFSEVATQDSFELAPGLNWPFEEAGYTLILPNSDPVGMAVFFHSGRDTSHPGFEMRFHREGISANLAVLYVSTGRHFEFLFEEEQFLKLDRYIKQALAESALAHNKVAFLGMSLAGTRAFRFARWCLEGRSTLQPSAVIACDAPLDFRRFEEALRYARDNETHPVSIGEANWVLHQLHQNLGTPDSNNLNAYIDYSLVSRTGKPDLRLLEFNKVGIRLYTEPDLAWWMANRNADLFAINAIDASTLIRDLRVLGHQKSELIVTEKKGFHPDGTRHPHSWSIVDNEELALWLAGIFRTEG